MSAAPFTEKAWATVRAAAALQGIALWRTNPADGSVRVLAVDSSSRAHLLRDDEIQALLVGPNGVDQAAQGV